MKNNKMFYNYITENNINVYNKLVGQIRSILVNKYCIYDEVKLEDAISHTIENIIKEKRDKNKEALSDSHIKKNIKYAAYKVFNNDKKAGLIRKDIDENGKKIYIKDYLVVNTDSKEDNEKSTIENLSGDIPEVNKLDLYFLVKSIRERYDILTGKVLYYMLQGDTNIEISKELNIEVSQVQNIKYKVKKYLQANKDIFGIES